MEGDNNIVQLATENDELADYKQKLIDEFKQTISNSHGYKDMEELKIEIPDDILLKMFANNKNSEKTVLEDYEKSVNDKCHQNAVVDKQVDIIDGTHTVIIKSYVSNYSDDRYLYNYIKIYDKEKNNILVEFFDVTANNEVVISLLNHLVMTDDELNLKYTDSLTYRRKLVTAIESLWD